MTEQIFVYKVLFTIVFFGEKKSRNLSHFENENTFRKRTRKLTMCSKETEVKTKPQKTVPFGDTRPTDRADNLR